MMLVDASVWIDFFRQANTPQCRQLTQCLEEGSVTVGTADLVMFEVLRGFRRDAACQEAEFLLSALPQVEIGGAENALTAAALYRRLRARGCTIRSPIDVLLASYCISHGHVLLHSDADFDLIGSFEDLNTWSHGTTRVP
jgi:predicted nucleic acid-binding protein